MKYVINCIILISCSPDPTTNFETTILNSHKCFDQLEFRNKSLKAGLFLFVHCFSVKNNLICSYILENSGFVVLELDIGFVEQDIGP